MKKQKRRLAWKVLILCVLLLAGAVQGYLEIRQETQTSQAESLSLEEIPGYAGEAYVELQGNEPDLSQEDLTEEPFEEYSALDELGRCGEAFANVGTETMPKEKEKRASIGRVEPTGWHSVKYDNVQGRYLYNRCHLIGYQLTAENANEKNLITGTRYLNVEGMLPFEDMVADYVKETDNHVLYRVTPVFEGDDLVASGIQMEALSVEDQGEGVRFNVYVYNVQPGIWIDYETGESARLEDIDRLSSKKIRMSDDVSCLRHYKLPAVPAAAHQFFQH